MLNRQTLFSKPPFIYSMKPILNLFVLLSLGFSLQAAKATSPPAFPLV